MNAETDFPDVTLASEDNQLIGSNQLILVSAKMSPDGGQPIVKTVLAVVRAKRDHTAITKEWKKVKL